jgi:hypothetical protein
VGGKGSGGCESPPSRILSEEGSGGGCEVKPLRLTFERGRGLWWVVVGVKPVHLAFQAREGWVVVGVKPLRLAFRAREGWVVGRLPLRHSK